jgi:hypothetical protein
MLFSAFVLVSVYGKHDSLQERIYLGHGDESAEVGNVAWFGLEEKEKVAVFLGFFIVWEEAFGDVGGVFQVTGDFFALRRKSAFKRIVGGPRGGYLFKSHAILNQQGYS